MGSRPRCLARCKDRISALPDALLCHILSFLQTIFAVRTTVLSKRWKNVWTSVPRLYFDALDGSPDTDDFHSFITFVDRVLFFRDSTDIQTLCLELIEVDRDVVSRVGDWLCTAAWRNVVVVHLYLHLFLHDLRDSKECSLEFTQSLFTCKTLVHLRLSSNCMNYAPPTSVCFPRLKTLHVTHLYPDDEDSTENLFSCCPVLKSLTIDGLINSFDKDRAHNFCISIPSLQSLKIILDTNNLFSSAGYNFAIDCPKLKNLHIRMDEDANFSLGCAKRLVRANIDVIEYPENEGEAEEDGRPPFLTRATALLALLLGVRYLSLHIHCFEDSRLPNFLKLKQMNLVLHECNYWDVLLHLLIRTPYLEHLVFEASRKCCRPSLHGNRGKESSEEEYSELQWSPPKNMPGCLLLKLKTITIKEFKGRRDEMEVVKYLLKKSAVLDRMTIYIRKMSDRLPYVEEKVLLKKFLWFERGSKACRVEIFN